MKLKKNSNKVESKRFLPKKLYSSNEVRFENKTKYYLKRKSSQEKMSFKNRNLTIIFKSVINEILK